MSFCGHFFSKRSNGAVAATILILLFASLGAVTTALAVTNRTFENQIFIIKSAKRNNIASQALSVTEKWFVESVENGGIPAPKNSVNYDLPNESPIYVVPPLLLESLIKHNQESEIIGYVVDAYYKISTEEIEKTDTLFIEPHSFSIYNNESKINYNARHYFINVFTSLNISEKEQLHFNKEIMVLRSSNNELLFLPLGSKKQLINKTNN